MKKHIIGRTYVNVKNAIQVSFNEFYLGGNTYCSFEIEETDYGAQFLLFNRPAYVYRRID